MRSTLPRIALSSHLTSGGSDTTCNAPDFGALRPKIRSATCRRAIIPKIKQELTKWVHTKSQQEITICRSLKILKYNLITYLSKFTD